jgi:outer membrane receptor protein involved in Fe transport
MEYRRESMNQISDPYGFTVSTVTNAPGQYRVGNYGPQAGSYDVIEGYVETVVPLLRNVPWAQSVDFNGAVRETGYSTAGNTFTWKAGLTWDVDDDVRVRATRSRDVRAPNLSELFSGLSFGHGSIIDYVTPGNPVNAQAFNYTQGNPNLKAEVGNTTTAGVVLQPSWFSGFQASIDWFNIDISNNIASVGSQQIVLNCSQGATAQCAYITRDAAGNLTGVYAVPQNLVNQSYAGVDFEGNYNFDLQDISEMEGNITLHGILNYVYKYIQTTQGVPTNNLAGTQGNPMWRGTFQVSYNNGPFSWFTQARWSGSDTYTKQIPVTTLPLIHIGAQTLIDMNVEYAIPVGHGAVTPFLNVTNIFNDTPPPDPTPNTAAYGSNQYDSLGRVFRTGIRFKF